jgi:hypothetical protein
VKILNPPVVDPAGIVTEPGVEATLGLLLVTCRNWSTVDVDATVIVANEPAVPVTEAGLSAIEAG